MELESEESDYYECEAAISGGLCLSLGSDAEKIKTVEISLVGRESKAECIERKISSFGFFSEDLAAVLLGLLKDNEKMQSVIENGFKENEMKQRQMFDVIQSEHISRIDKRIKDVETKQQTMHDMIQKENNRRIEFALKEVETKQQKIYDVIQNENNRINTEILNVKNGFKEVERKQKSLFDVIQNN